MTDSTENLDGDYVPDIPLPVFHLILKRCPWPKCNEGYFSMPGYRGHYALAHICNLPKHP